MLNTIEIKNYSSVPGYFIFQNKAVAFMRLAMKTNLSTGKEKIKLVAKSHVRAHEIFS